MIETQSHHFQVLYFANDAYAVYRVQAGNVGRVSNPCKDIKVLNRLCRKLAKADGVQAFTR